MTIFYDDKKATQGIKTFLKPHSTNKVTNPKEKISAPKKEINLPIRGNSK
jgi:hypothetical protein